MNQTNTSEIIETGRTLDILKKETNHRISKCCGNCKKAPEKNLFSVICDIFGDRSIFGRCDWHEWDLKEKLRIENMESSLPQIHKTYHPEGS